MWEQCFSIKTIETDNVASVMKSTDANIDVTNFINNKNEWIFYSGCSHHTTGDATLLSDVSPHLRKWFIVTANNSLHLVIKEGNFNLNVEGNSLSDNVIALKDVYHVPSLKKNLASVSQITGSCKYVLFGPNDVKILDKFKYVAADVLLTGKKEEEYFIYFIC